MCGALLCIWVIFPPQQKLPPKLIRQIKFLEDQTLGATRNSVVDTTVTRFQPFLLRLPALHSNGNPILSYEMLSKTDLVYITDHSLLWYPSTVGTHHLLIKGIDTQENELIYKYVVAVK